MAHMAGQGGGAKDARRQDGFRTFMDRALGGRERSWFLRRLRRPPRAAGAPQNPGPAGRAAPRAPAEGHGAAGPER